MPKSNIMKAVKHDLAKGNREYAALLAALNSVFEILSYSLLVWLFIYILPRKLGLTNFNVSVSIKDVTQRIIYHDQFK